MTPEEVINYLESISEQKAEARVTSARTVRDLVIHLAAWKQEATDTYIELCEEGKKPWFWGQKDLSKFNKEIDEKYRDLSYKEAIEFLKKTYRDRDALQGKYTREKLNEAGLGWMFEDNSESHAILHLEQIQKALGKKFTPL
jgi:hypothetical protein